MVPDRAEFVNDCSLPKLDPAPEEEILSIRRESQLIKSQTDHLMKPTCQQTSITPTLKGFGAAGDKPVISLSLIDELGRTKDGGITPSEPVSGSTTATNTESNVCDSPLLVDEPTERVVMVLPNRSLEETLDIFNSSDPHLGPSHLTDEEIVVLVQQGKVAAYALEKVLKDFTRAVRIRRALIC
jgi:hydroxymethylglutaryl-CoA reductase (NADPH)